MIERRQSYSKESRANLYFRRFDSC